MPPQGGGSDVPEAERAVPGPRGDYWRLNWTQRCGVYFSPVSSAHPKPGQGPWDLVLGAEHTKQTGWGEGGMGRASGASGVIPAG